MVIKKVNKHVVDVFLDINTLPTGFEPSCWLRLQNRQNRWVQIAGIKVLAWQFKKITDSL